MAEIKKQQQNDNIFNSDENTRRDTANAFESSKKNSLKNESIESEELKLKIE